ncbi:MAG: serine/threonine protein phosphatase [Clostridia bacterium]|nr:serine/threonine protein phosphatase [Clostridia bacterium]
MKLTKRKNQEYTSVLQTAKKNSHPFAYIDSYTPLSNPQLKLYATLREAVPIIDAAILKLVRMTGGFKVECSNKRTEKALADFLRQVNVGGNQLGIEAFISSYFEQLLTYGTAVGEIVISSDSKPVALYNASLDNIELVRSENGLDVDIYVTDGAKKSKIPYPDLALLSVLNPEPGRVEGTSMLKGLPFVSSVFLKIANTIGTNWERVGNVRFAVTYKPVNDVLDKAFARDRAMQIAEEWGNAMQSGSVKDFVAVGDVGIKVIGADNQILDSEIPVRQMLEQIVAKTGLPPFMLGLSWSSTERMSSQQADALTSELEAFRRILTPIIEKISKIFLRLNGYDDDCFVVWEDITLQDYVELSKSRLYDAQTKKLLSETISKEEET